LRAGLSKEIFLKACAMGKVRCIALPGVNMRYVAADVEKLAAELGR
jgi:hypothetical protein